MSTTLPIFNTRRKLLRAGAAFGVLPFSSIAFAQNQDLRSKIEAIRAQFDLPAIACLLLNDSEIIAHAFTGVRKYGDTPPIRLHDKFHLGSCTKAMTAHLCAQLVEAGKIAWDQPLLDAVPDWAQHAHLAYRNLTLDHLLCQHSGFSSDNGTRDLGMLALHALQSPPMQQRATYTHAILADAPVSPPGSTYAYSNRNFVVAGHLSEKLTGIAWENLIRNQLFNPLHMQSAGFGPMNHRGEIDQPWQHIVRDQKHFPIDSGPMSDNPVAMIPAGGVHMTLADWAQFALDHLHGLNGKNAQLRPDSYRHLHTPLANGSYAGGWGVQQRDWAGGTAYTHSGSNTMNYCTIWLAPEKNLVLLVACNEGGENAMKGCEAAAVCALRATL